MKKEPMSSATISLKMWYTLLKLLISFFVFSTFSLASISSSSPPPDHLSYGGYCHSIVPGSGRRYSDLQLSESQILQHHTGYYTSGGSDIFGQYSYQPYYEPQKSVVFSALNVKRTYEPGVFRIQGNLLFQRASIYHYQGNVTSSLPRYPGGGRLRSQSNAISFKLDGFWSATSGKLCMVGSSSTYSKQGKRLNVPAVLKLNNLMNFTSLKSLVSGTLESLTIYENDPRYFEPVSIIMLPRMNYKYSLVSNKSDNNSTGRSNVQPSFLPIKRFCSALSRVIRHEFDLKYSSQCVSAKNCSTPVAVSDLPRAMSLEMIACSEDKQRLRFLVVFADGNNLWNERPFNPTTTLVGEGSWDAERNQLHIVACQFLNATVSFTNRTHVGDCSTRLSLSFPAIWTIGSTSSTVGQIWSNKSVTELGYFDRITFESPLNDIGKVLLPGLKYEYTKIEKVMQFCPRKKTAHSKKYKYPVAGPYGYDMSFDMSVKNSEGEVSWGSAVPLSVGNKFYHWYANAMAAKSIPGFVHSSTPVSSSYNTSIPLNISYIISMTFNQRGNVFHKLRKHSSSDEVNIHAEGIYDGTEGRLCMVGCTKLGSSSQQPTNHSVDCEILVNFQFPPRDSKESLIKGSIKSLRKKSDPLYFETLDSASISGYLVVAERSIWRMDVEIILVLISTTLACVFVALQIFHVRKNGDVLPSISISMLLILTLGYMIPLLNFGAMFKNNSNPASVFLGSGGWLEVKEVIVRVITMVAFLLQIRLLQLTWSARSANGTQKELWLMEKKALFVGFPVYAAGALAALLLILLLNGRKNEIHAAVFTSDPKLRKHPTLGNPLKSYAGLVLDGFLIPQILFNMFCKSKGKALSAAFYIGTTFLRVLPYAYDLYRAHNSDHNQLKVSFIYASPVADFYSTAWDVIIPFVGLLFAGIVYLQQKFGGLCILPEKLRDFFKYEKVPTVTEG